MFALAIFLPIIAKILIHLDYLCVIVLVWAYVFDARGQNEQGLLSADDLHTVFVILIYVAALAIWFGLQQIRVFNIYVFRFVACALSAYVFVHFVSTGLFGRAIADGMDTIWQWTVGIVYFAVIVFLRVKDNSLVLHRQFD